MRYSGIQITFQEIPNEICLAIHISGCPLACPGCHSAELRDKTIGIDLSLVTYEQLIHKYNSYITCIVFMGGEWYLDMLIQLIQLTKKFEIKTALYTGLEFDQVSSSLVNELDYIKVGPYIAKLGGLNSLYTNQRLIDLKKKCVIKKNKNEVYYETYK